MDECVIYVVLLLTYTPWAGPLDVTRGEEMFLQL
jgi:hypothetical protein